MPREFWNECIHLRSVDTFSKGDLSRILYLRLLILFITKGMQQLAGGCLTGHSRQPQRKITLYLRLVFRTIRSVVGDFFEGRGDHGSGLHQSA